MHSQIDSSFVREDDVQYMGGKSEGGRKQNKKQDQQSNQSQGFFGFISGSSKKNQNDLSN